MIEDVDRGTMSGQYRADGRLDLSDLPFLRREIMKGDQYLTTNLVLAGRGCPYACEYCSVTEFFGHTYRHRPVEQVVAEIASLPRRLVLFGDDNLVADRDFAKRLFRAMIPLGKKWMSQMNLAVAQDDDLLRLAARSGCCGAFLGLESITQANLVAADKSFYDVARYRELIRKLVDHGIAVMAGFVFGFDEDDDGVFERTIEFATNTPLLAAQIAILTPFPGTKLYSRLERDGRIIDRDWSKYDFRHVVFRPARMTPERLQEGADAAIKQFYGLEEIGRRAVLAVSCWGLKDAFLMGLPINLAYRRSLSKGL